MKDTTIYPHTFEYARDNGELDAYRKSNDLNRDCAIAIDKSIAANRHDQHYYSLFSALSEVSEEFGLERVSWVVAATVQNHNYDDRYSRDNREWARHYSIPNDRGAGILLNTHPAVLNRFVTTVQIEQIRNLAQTVGAYERSHHITERNRLTVFSDDLGRSIAKLGVTERQLSDRYTEITEKQSVLAQLRAARNAETPAPASVKKHHEAER